MAEQQKFWQAPPQQAPATQSDAYLAAIRDSLGTIKTILVFWTVLGGIGLLVMVLLMFAGMSAL